MEHIIKLPSSDKNLASKLSFIFAIMATLVPNTALTLDFSFQSIQADIEKKHQNIKHIKVGDLLKLDHNTIIFDVREKQEFDVSHIKNAIRIKPDIDSIKFIETFSNQLKGKNLVFYCSVGRRSSALAPRLQPLLIKEGVHEVYNLKGGIFQWHNEEKSLVQNGQLTKHIHPYSPLWGLLLENKKSIKYSPDTPADKPE